jgi:hypothetical protein
MRSRLLARIAALVLAGGGLLVIPAGPASAHCGDNAHDHPDRVDSGAGIFWEGVDQGGTPIRRGPHDGPENECVPFAVPSAGDGINVHCALETPSANDWIYAASPGFAAGWARERQYRVPNAVFILGCDNPNHSVLITG